MITTFYQRIFGKASIAKKITLAVLCTSVITLLLLSVGFYYFNLSLFNQQRANHLNAVADLVASSAEAALLFDDRETAQEYLSFLSKDTDLIEALLLDENGNAFARFSPENTLLDLSKIPTESGLLWTDSALISFRPMMMDERVIGFLYLEIGHDTMRQFLFKNLVVAVILFVCAVFLTIWLAIRFSRTVTAPITGLSALAGQVASTNDYSKKAEPVFDDEVGSLVRSFNTMLEQIEQRDLAINESRNRLEVEVKERTRELESANASLLEAIEKAKEASKAKSDFLSVMSHELRTPMNAIVGMAALLDEEIEDEGSHEAISIIRKSASSLLVLLNDILDYSKIEAGGVEIEHVPFELYPVLTDPFLIAMAQNDRTDLLYIVECDKRVPQAMIGDPLRLSQIITNLLGNAVKFTESGRIELIVDVEICSGDSFLRVQVIDTGIGIPKGRMDRLFVEFSQVDASTTRRYGGTGLGLAISQRLAHAMKGAITVKSEVGVGTTFTLHIPLESDPTAGFLGDRFQLQDNTCFELMGFDPDWTNAFDRMIRAVGGVAAQDEAVQADLCLLFGANGSMDAISKLLSRANERYVLSECVIVCGVSDAANWSKRFGCRTLSIPVLPNSLIGIVKQNVPQRQPAAAVAEPSGDVALKILLVEDNEVNQRVFSRILRTISHELDIADDGVRAIELMDKRQYDMVFMDFMMPRMNGLDTTKVIRSTVPTDRQPYIIGLTADVDKGTSEKLLNAGMNDYLSKPISRADIREAIDRFLETTGSR